MNDTDMAILDFEREWWRHAGTKYQDVSERWGLAPSEYEARLIAIAVRPEAFDYDPLTVSRIRRRNVPRASQDRRHPDHGGMTLTGHAHRDER